MFPLYFTGIDVGRAMKGGRGVVKVMFLKRGVWGDATVYIPWLGDDLAVGVALGLMRRNVPDCLGKSVCAAVCEGRTLKYPKRDLEAIVSVSSMYFSLILSKLFIFLKWNIAHYIQNMIIHTFIHHDITLRQISRTPSQTPSLILPGK